MIPKQAIADLIILALVVSAFYKHGTRQNIWYKIGKWSRKII